MKIRKIDGLYRKPGLRGKSKVPLLVWLPLLLIIAAVLLAAMLQTWLLQNGDLPSAPKVRKHAYRVAAVGDIACSPNDINFNEGEGVVNGCQQKIVGQVVEQENTDAVFLLGDIQQGGAFTDYERSFVQYWRDIQSSIYSVPGEQDYSAGNLDEYYSIFSTFFENATYQKEGKSYYQFGLGQWDIFALDSTCTDDADCGFDSTQYNWLTRQVTMGVAKCSIAFWHHPSGAGATSGTDFAKLARDSGIDIILNAHERYYERSLTDGTRQFIVGTGGMSTKRIKSLSAGSEKVVDDSFGYLYLELYPGRYTWQFIDVGGEVLDEGQATCS